MSTSSDAGPSGDEDAATDVPLDAAGERFPEPAPPERPWEEQLEQLSAADRRARERLAQQQTNEGTNARMHAAATGGRHGALQRVHPAGAPAPHLRLVPRPFSGPPEKVPLTAEQVDELVRRRVPEKFQGITWHNLARLVGDENRPSLGELESERGGRINGEAAVHEIRHRFERGTHRQWVILGETRAGKTVTAAAALEAELRRGNDRATWVNAEELKQPEMLERALSAQFLVLDDLGYELHGAKPGSGWLPSLTAPAYAFFGKWYQLRGRRLIVTTFLPLHRTAKTPGMGELYEGGVAARVYEGADTICLYRD